MGDGKRFDELSRIWARPMSRRRALRLSAGVLFGGLGTTLLSARPAAAVGCTTSSDCSFLSHPCCANPTGGTAAGACNSLAPGSVCCQLTNGGSLPRKKRVSAFWLQV